MILFFDKPCGQSARGTFTGKGVGRVPSLALALPLEFGMVLKVTVKIQWQHSVTGSDKAKET